MDHAVLVRGRGHGGRARAPPVVEAGLGACFFGLFEHEDGVVRAFGVPARGGLVGTVALGHPAPDRPGRSAAGPVGRCPTSCTWPLVKGETPLRTRASSSPVVVATSVLARLRLAIGRVLVGSPRLPARLLVASCAASASGSVTGAWQAKSAADVGPTRLPTFPQRRRIRLAPGQDGVRLERRVDSREPAPGHHRQPQPRWRRHATGRQPPSGASPQWDARRRPHRASREPPLPGPGSSVDAGEGRQAEQSEGGRAVGRGGGVVQQVLGVARSAARHRVRS